MQIPPGLVFLFRLTDHQQRVLVHGDIDLFGGEPGHRHRQPVSILTGLFDVVGRVGEGGVVDTSRRIDQTRQAIEADRRTEQRREIETIHDHILL